MIFAIIQAILLIYVGLCFYYESKDPQYANINYSFYKDGVKLSVNLTETREMISQINNYTLNGTKNKS